MLYFCKQINYKRIVMSKLNASFYYFFYFYFARNCEAGSCV